MEKVKGELMKQIEGRAGSTCTSIALNLIRSGDRYAASLYRLQVLLTLWAGAGTSTCSNSTCTKGA